LNPWPLESCENPPTLLEKNHNLESIKTYYRVDRRQIFFLKFILEAYDGIAMFTTIDPAAGIVMLRISPGCESEVDMLLNDLKKNILIEHTEQP
jgi:hypothetical protein